MTKFNHKDLCFDVPKGRMTLKSEVKGIHNMKKDEDNDPKWHPYYIIDPFDINHNPGKQVKY